MTNTFKWFAGKQITGTYCGVAFEGAMNEASRPHTMRNDMVLFIDLTNPIIVHGETRQSICMEVNQAGVGCLGNVQARPVTPSEEAVTEAAIALRNAGFTLEELLSNNNVDKHNIIKSAYNS